MSAIGQYLQDTRAELRHVAWPTRTQTIVYTIMVALLSIGVALYLGLFDYIFTTSLTRALSVLPANTNSGLQVTQQPVQTAPTQAAPTNTTAQPLAPINPTNTLKIVPDAPGTQSAPQAN